MSVWKFIYIAAAFAGQYLVFQKMGRQGWEGLVPFYSTYVLFEKLYGKGWKCLTLLIPIYNIYVAFKLYIDLAHSFGMPTAFGIGLTLLTPVFLILLACGDAKYIGPDYGAPAQGFTPDYSDPSENVIEGYDNASSGTNAKQ